MPSAKPTKFHVNGERSFVFVRGDVTQRLQIVQDSFFDSLSMLPRDRSLDLIRIAAGVYAIDRIVRRDFVADDLGSRTLAVETEVFEPEFWTQSDISNLLGEILEFLTGDSWQFSFSLAPSRAARDGHQTRLPVGTVSLDRIALFSGGLDSMAGLASRLLTRKDTYGLLTVGHQAAVRRRCVQSIQHLKAQLNGLRVHHSSIVLRLRKGKAIRLSLQEQTQRSRAFLFCALAAVMAQAMECSEIDIFENGVGSINVPIMTGMMFGTLSTRGCHPTFLSRMSDLCAKTIDSKLNFNLPFANMTKGEVLIDIKNAGLEEWLQTSHSCVHTSPRVRGISHCGVCPACIERRQAFAVAEMLDQTKYGKNIYTHPPTHGHQAAYFRTYLDEACAWIAGNRRSESRFSSHLQLTGIVPTDFQSFRRLRQRHSQEVVRTYLESQMSGAT